MASRSRSAPAPARSRGVHEGSAPGGSATGPLPILLSADPESFLYGVAHLDAGRLRDLDVQGAVIAVEVNDDRPRIVRLGDGGVTCPCPQGMARGAACEHQVAVALRQVHRRTGIEVNDLVAAWFEGVLAGVVPPDTSSRASRRHQLFGS